MRFQIQILPLVFLSSLFLIHHASSQRSTYIIHMDKSSMPKAYSSCHHWYSTTINSMRAMNVEASEIHHHREAKLVHTYGNAFHGFTAVLSENELESLRNSPGFISAHKDKPIVPDTTHTHKFLGLNTASGIWPESKYGEDVIIGVVDTGIWPESPSFRDEGLPQIPARWKGTCQAGQDFNSSHCNKKIIGARFFNQGVLAASPDVKISMNSTRDIFGHGTHVASIAAGSQVEGASFFGYAPGTARGVAPRARLAIYKVLWDEGAYESDALAGIDQAVADGVDVLSISLSYLTIDLYENPIAIAAFGAMEKGILVSVSAGNRGPSFGTVLEGIPWAVIVASGTVDRWFSGELTLGNGVSITGWTMFPARATVRNSPLVYNETLSACNSTEVLREAPSDSIIICVESFETPELEDQITYVTESNIHAVVFVSDDTGVLRSTSFPLPGVVITPKEGKDVIRYASRSSQATATIQFQHTILGPKPRPAPAVSTSSSRGPARSYPGILKPDIMAPGVLILAAYNPNTPTASIGTNIALSSDYNLESGTSMACPHISGVAALLKSIHPKWSPAAIRSAMMTTANPLDNTGKPIKDMGNDYDAATPLGMGAGQVDPNRALDPGLIYDAFPQDYVNLVCALNYTREQTQTILRSSYNCSSPSTDLNYPAFVALYDPQESRTLKTQRFRRTVTNVGEGRATYKVKVKKPKDTVITVSPERLIFRKKNEKRSYSLTIRYQTYEEYVINHGSITWIEQNGNHTVRSPVVVTPAEPSG
ncbi:subtilisin-like protease SBT3 [Salvia hispanica]|uniref:subtilisin-like protease SBT3 n=1 Tax=Salvia hispanica TaxID=49212 RepID=UPI002009320D|nr:subtilisin-like protease SBT3 [Salvia hispanica]